MVCGSSSSVMMQMCSWVVLAPGGTRRGGGGEDEGSAAARRRNSGRAPPTSSHALMLWSPEAWENASPHRLQATGSGSGSGSGLEGGRHGERIAPAVVRLVHGFPRMDGAVSKAHSPHAAKRVCKAGGSGFPASDLSFFSFVSLMVWMGGKETASSLLSPNLSRSRGPGGY